MGSIATMDKSFHAQTITSAGTYSFPRTQIISITNYSTNSNSVQVADDNNGNKFDIQVGETVTLNWGFVNSSLKIKIGSSDTVRVIYYT